MRGGRGTDLFRPFGSRPSGWKCVPRLLRNDLRSSGIIFIMRRHDLHPGLVEAVLNVGVQVAQRFYPAIWRRKMRVEIAADRIEIASHGKERSVCGNFGGVVLADQPPG